MTKESRKQQGMTLVEAVIAIVVIAIAVTAVLGVLARNVGASADAMIVSQGITIAEADGADGEIGRASFDDVDDYDGLLDAGAADQFGNPMPDLAGYTVSVSVNASSGLPGVGAADAYRIDVRVQFASSVDYTLSGYRTRL
jgi:MSHA pilin protein MshD